MKNTPIFTVRLYSLLLSRVSLRSLTWASLLRIASFSFDNRVVIFLGFRLQGPPRIIFTARPDCRESFSSTPDLKQGINKEQIFMTKFWMSTKKQQTMSWDSFFLFSMKHCTISDFIVVERILYCYNVCFEGRILWVSKKLLFIYLNHFRSIAFSWIWIAEEDSRRWPGHVRGCHQFEGTSGPVFLLQPFGYSANTSSLKTLCWNRRITAHGTEMLIQKTKIKEAISELLSTKAKVWIANSSHLWLLSVC